LLALEGVGVESEVWTGAAREGVLAVLGVEPRTEPAGVELGFFAMAWAWVRGVDEGEMGPERRSVYGWWVSRSGGSELQRSVLK
jgi:hypothetical protein